MKLSKQRRGKKGTWWATGYVNGERVRQSLGTSDPDEADRRLLDFERTVMGGAKPDPGMTLEKWLPVWMSRLEQLGREPTTLQSYRNYCRRYYVPRLGKIRLDRMTVADVQEFDAWLLAGGAGGKKLTPTSVAQIHNILSSALHEAERDGLIIRNVASLARRPKRPRSEARWLEVAEALSLLGQARSHPWGPFAAVAMMTGLRNGELCGLRWDDVDMDKGTLSIVRQRRREPGGWKDAHPKSESGRRIVPLSSEAVEWLKAKAEEQKTMADLLRVLPPPWVFAHRDHQQWVPYATSSAAAGVKSLYAAAGVEAPIRPVHALRHTVGALLAEAQHDLRLRMALLGHANAQVASLYAHATEDAKRRAMDDVSRLLSGGAE